jgi:hypothetical protein
MSLPCEQHCNSDTPINDNPHDNQSVIMSQEEYENGISPQAGPASCGLSLSLLFYAAAVLSSPCSYQVQPASNQSQNQL